MKIGLVRGDFVNPWELQNFRPIVNRVNLTIFTGFYPISRIPAEFETKQLVSPVDLNFGNISKFKMGVLNRIFSDAHLLFNLENELKGFDIAHCAETYYGFTAQSIKAKLANKVNFVVSTVWENIPFNNEKIENKLKNKMLSRRHIDLFLPVTKTAANTLELEGIEKKRIRLLRPGVDTNLFKPNLKVSSYNKFNKRKKKISLFVGRLEKEKGVEDLVRIYGSLIRNTETHLLIVGTGSLQSKLQSIVNNTKNKNIHFLGGVPYREMYKIYNLSDLLIHPAFGSETWQEQYGMVLIEAMACGLPIVGANSGAIPEILGTSGIVAEKKSIFFEAVELVKNKKKMEILSRSARRRVELEFDREKYSKKILSIYSELVKNHHIHV